MLQPRLRSSFRITPPPVSSSDSTGLSCHLDDQRNRLAALPRVPHREAHVRLVGRVVNWGTAAPGHGIARVMRACCSGIAPVLRACWSLGYPLGIPWVALGSPEGMRIVLVGISATLRCLPRVPAGPSREQPKFDILLDRK